MVTDRERGEMAAILQAAVAIHFLDAAVRRAMRRERVFRDRENAFELDDIAFRQLFRLPTNLVLDLCDQLRPFLPAARRFALSLETKVNHFFYSIYYHIL